MKKRLLLTIFLTLLIPIGLFAADTKPVFEVNIPTVNLTELNKCTKNKVLCIPWIAEYIVGIYKYGVGVAGILASIVLMWGGVIWLTAGGNQQRVTEAQSWIKGSITGLILLFTSYVLLYQINPSLTKLTYIKIPEVQEIDTAVGSASAVPLSSTGKMDRCPGDSPCTKNAVDPSELVDINSERLDYLHCKNTHSCKVKRTTYEKLKEVALVAKSKGKELWVRSAGRTVKYQKEKFDQSMPRHNNSEIETCQFVSWPNNCAPHVQNIAVDVCLCKKDQDYLDCWENGGCQGIANSDSMSHQNSSVPLLKEIMYGSDKKAFVRHPHEWWHFEFPPDPNLPGRVRN